MSFSQSLSNCPCLTPRKRRWIYTFAFISSFSVFFNLWRWRYSLFLSRLFVFSFLVYLRERSSFFFHCLALRRNSSYASLFCSGVLCSVPGFQHEIQPFLLSAKSRNLLRVHVRYISSRGVNFNNVLMTELMRF